MQTKNKANRNEYMQKNKNWNNNSRGRFGRVKTGKKIVQELGRKTKRTAKSKDKRESK